MGSQQSVAGELQGLHEKCVDALAEPKGAEDAPRLRALLGDVLTAIGRLQGGAASDDADEAETEAASEDPDLGNDDEGDAEDEDDAIDELAPVDADAVIRRGEAWSDPTFPANEASLGLRDDVDEGRGPESRGWGGVTWARCGELFKHCRLFRNAPSPFDVAQGGLGDCYLLSALCVLAERPARIYKLFETTELNTAGLVGARLYLHGEERLVLVCAETRFTAPSS